MLFFPPFTRDGEEEECITLEKGKGKKKSFTAVPSSWDIFNQNWRLTYISVKEIFSFPLWLCYHLCSRQGLGLNLSS